MEAFEVYAVSKMRKVQYETQVLYLSAFAVFM